MARKNGASATPPITSIAFEFEPPTLVINTDVRLKVGDWIALDRETFGFRGTPGQERTRLTVPKFALLVRLALARAAAGRRLASAQPVYVTLAEFVGIIDDDAARSRLEKSVGELFADFDYDPNLNRRTCLVDVQPSANRKTGALDVGSARSGPWALRPDAELTIDIDRARSWLDALGRPLAAPVAPASSPRRPAKAEPREESENVSLAERASDEIRSRLGDAVAVYVCAADGTRSPGQLGAQMAQVLFQLLVSLRCASVGIGVGRLPFHAARSMACLDDDVPSPLVVPLEIGAEPRGRAWTVFDPLLNATVLASRVGSIDTGTHAGILQPAGRLAVADIDTRSTMTDAERAEAIRAWHTSDVGKEFNTYWGGVTVAVAGVQTEESISRGQVPPDLRDLPVQDRLRQLFELDIGARFCGRWIDNYGGPVGILGDDAVDTYTAAISTADLARLGRGDGTALIVGAADLEGYPLADLVAGGLCTHAILDTRAAPRFIERWDSKHREWWGRRPP